MKALSLNFWGQTKAWWVVLVVGILFVIGGFCYWFWPVAGFAITDFRMAADSGRHRAAMCLRRHKPAPRMGVVDCRRRD